MRKSIDVLLDNDALTPAQKRVVRKLVPMQIRKAGDARVFWFGYEEMILSSDKTDVKEFKLRVYKRMIYSLIWRKLINIPYGPDHDLVIKLMLVQDKNNVYKEGKIILIKGNVYSIPADHMIPVQNLYKVLMIVKRLGLL